MVEMVPLTGLWGPISFVDIESDSDRFQADVLNYRLITILK
jgi:hypothetical protein